MLAGTRSGCPSGAWPRHGLENERNGVDAEAGDAELQPEADDPSHLLAHERVVHVEVGLEVVETVEVVLPRFPVEVPRALLLSGKDNAAAEVRRSPPRPDVPSGAVRGRIACLAKPRVPVRGVVHDEVDQDADSPSVGLMDELDEVAARAEARVDAVVVGDVVAVVPAWRGLEWRQP